MNSNNTYIYYIYAYIRSKPSRNGRFPAGTPYYIGKGKGKDYRCYKPHKGIVVPKDRRYIVIMESNLSNCGALALDRRYIMWYGRVASGTGCLRNLTDGGDGHVGRVSVKDKDGNTFSVDVKDERLLSGELVGVKRGIKLSQSHLDTISRCTRGRRHTKETLELMSISAKKRNRSWIPSDDFCNSIKERFSGVPQSENHIKKRIDKTIGVKKIRYDLLNIKYIFPDNTEVIMNTTFVNFCRAFYEYKLTSSTLGMVYNRKAKSHKGFRCFPTEEPVTYNLIRMTVSE